ncbi:MAG: hypothetical protein ABII74_04555 [Elusimicrobiota bacterium]
MPKITKLRFCGAFLIVSFCFLVLPKDLQSSQNSAPERLKFEEQKIAEKKSKPKRILKTEKYFDKSIGRYADVVAGEILVKHLAGR